MKKKKINLIPIDEIRDTMASAFGLTPLKDMAKSNKNGTGLRIEKSYDASDEPICPMSYDREASSEALKGLDFKIITEKYPIRDELRIEYFQFVSDKHRTWTWNGLDTGMYLSGIICTKKGPFNDMLRVIEQAPGSSFTCPSGTYDNLAKLTNGAIYLLMDGRPKGKYRPIYDDDFGDYYLPIRMISNPFGRTIKSLKGIICIDKELANNLIGISQTKIATPKQLFELVQKYLPNVRNRNREVPICETCNELLTATAECYEKTVHLRRVLFGEDKGLGYGKVFTFRGYKQDYLTPDDPQLYLGLNPFIMETYSRTDIMDCMYQIFVVSDCTVRDDIERCICALNDGKDPAFDIEGSEYIDAANRQFNQCGILTLTKDMTFAYCYDKSTNTLFVPCLFIGTSIAPQSVRSMVDQCVLDRQFHRPAVIAFSMDDIDLMLRNHGISETTGDTAEANLAARIMTALNHSERSAYKHNPYSSITNLILKK